MSDVEEVNPRTQWRSLKSKLLLKYADVSMITLVDTVNLMVQKLPQKALRKSLNKYHDNVCDLFGMEPVSLLDDEDDLDIHPHGHRPGKGSHIHLRFAIDDSKTANIATDTTAASVHETLGRTKVCLYPQPAECKLSMFNPYSHASSYCQQSVRTQ